MNRLTKVSSESDISPEYIDNPVGDLLMYHNLKKEFKVYDKATILIGMCMDNRKYLQIPENFAYILRTGGGNLRYSEFKVSFAISVGRIKHIALIAHNYCGMVNLFSRKNDFIEGLEEIAGWDREKAEEHFNHYAPLFEIGNEIDFLLSEVGRLRARYPGVNVTPLYYNLDDNLLYLIKE